MMEFALGAIVFGIGVLIGAAIVRATEKSIFSFGEDLEK